jgi:hypothetical protein
MFSSKEEAVIGTRKAIHSLPERLTRWEIPERTTILLFLTNTHAPLLSSEHSRS